MTAVVVDPILQARNAARLAAAEAAEAEAIADAADAEQMLLAQARAVAVYVWLS